MKRSHLITSTPLAILTIILSSSGAQAGIPCTSDADCASGYLCNVVGGTGCAAVSCARGQECPPPPPCEVVEIRECVAGAVCATDADCSPELRCLTSSYATCSRTGVACSKEQTDCPPPPPPDCQTTTVTQCVPRYQSSCTSDAECGPQLNCIPSRVCGCSGSGRIDPDTGEVIKETETCECHDGAPYCDLVNKDCSETSDCPPGWTCMDTPVPCTASSDGSSSCPTQPSTKQCTPPSMGSSGTRNGGDVSVGGGDTGSGSVPPTQGAGTGAPTGTGDKGATGEETGTPPTGANPGGPPHHTSPWVPPLGGGIWCQFSAMTPAGSPTGWSALLGLVGLAALRRRRSR